MIKKILDFLKNSVVNTKTGKGSSTRIMAYVISGLVVLFSLVFIGLEISAAVIALGITGKYIISNEIIIIFGSLLAQQLTLLGITKSNETSVFKAEKEVEKVNGKPTDTPKVEEPKTFLSFNEELTYDQACEIGDYVGKIVKHIEKNYPEHYFTKDKNILGRQGHGLSNASIQKIARLSKQKKDSALDKLLDDLYDVKKKYVK